MELCAGAKVLDFQMEAGSLPASAQPQHSVHDHVSLEHQCSRLEGYKTTT